MRKSQLLCYFPTIHALYIVLLFSTLSFIVAVFYIHRSYLPLGITLHPENRQFRYPRRSNMGECPPIFGKVTVFVVHGVLLRSMNYSVARRSLDCYLKTTNYSLIVVNLDSNARVNESCGMHKNLFYKKHCAAAEFLKDTDWMLVLDADTGVVNPNHCIEEWIDPSVDVLFYERFFNAEIAAGNYLVKNTPWAAQFLREWANYEFIQPKSWSGNDQGGLMMILLKTLLPEANEAQKQCANYWHTSSNYSTFMKAVICVRMALGAKRIWPGRIRFYRKAHAWVRDRWMTEDMWCSEDFMLHGWKEDRVNQMIAGTPFSSDINPDLCGVGYHGWNWKKDMYMSISIIRDLLEEAEQYYGSRFPNEARVIPFLDLPGVSKCYPDCEKVNSRQ